MPSRRRFNPGFKRQVVEEWMAGAATLAQLSRRYEVCPNLVRRWKQQYGDGALAAAISDRRPPPGCIHHSDRGVQYACDDYVRLLTEAGFQISMSRRGNPFDNAQAESFFKTLKHEEVNLTQYRNFEEAKACIPAFIESASWRIQSRAAALGAGLRQPG